MVADVGGIGDRSFNDGAYAGLVAAHNRLHVNIDALQSRAAADYQSNLTALANEGYDEIIAIGFLMQRDLREVAERYPNRHFAILDTEVSAPNVASISFREEQGSFLAGALAAMVSRSKTIAFLGGVDFPLLRKFEAGYAAGAREVDPKVTVLVKYIGSFEDVAAGKELTNVLFSQGADIVFVAAGRSGLGAIDAVRHRSNEYVIGVDSDQDALAPGRILTSMVKRIDVAVFRLAAATVAGKPPRGNIVLGLRENAVGLTPFTYTKNVITPDRIRRIERLRNDVIAGRIVPPATREALATFRPSTTGSR